MIPKPRGELCARLFQAMSAWPTEPIPGLDVEPDDDEDAQLALWTLYEFHYRGFDELDDGLEWEPALLRLRRGLEHDLEARLRRRYPGDAPDGALGEALFGYLAGHDGPAISSYVHRHANAGQVLELMRHRSIYHLKEFDPTAWVMPRLPVAAKAALMELAYDEYGGGDPNRLHSHLFAQGMRAAGLRPEYGAYVDEVPMEILEQNNAMTLFGLHRRLRGAALGHLAAFEATSSQPSQRMAHGLRRLGFDQDLVGYYTEHVEADAVHEQLACRVVCAALVEAEPELRPDVFFGAFTCLDLESRYAAHILDAWRVPEERWA